MPSQEPLIVSVLFLAIMVVCVVSWCYPWGRLSSTRQRAALHLPIVAIALYALYEWSMPPHMNIRVDVGILWPLLAVTLVLYVIRLALASRHKGNLRGFPIESEPPAGRS